MNLVWKRLLLSTLPAMLLLLISSCNSSNSASLANNPAAVNDPAISSTASAVARSPLWSSQFAANWQTAWGIRQKGSWGFQNMSVVPDASGQFNRVLRVRYPANSSSPNAARTDGTPLGGVQFYADLELPAQDALKLSYSVRFSPDFDFVKGGKLPGLFGGSVNSGGNIPDGTNGFSTRFMWRRQGEGEIYAYLPSSQENGTSIGRGAWRFKPGTWHRLEQEVTLNQPGKANGQVRVWLDGQEVLVRSGLSFRTSSALKIDGIFFSTFFGGSNASWATPKDVHIDFANFSVSSVETQS
ncbi:hypothetical protein H6F43_10040 [Leptolyngbya sp. FACHB-36]|uniref:polysaccharide lyase n=1 Tax=Leptolyngbya sp. FACHB-36 TaxID=2692808 RepID=UPI0016812141|nr:hypothetical protein [Leptolyngbya sp. FACHB-36]MBD2020528.1 hypothetical protein [Leptolyngbya sp. FACHB-36]